MGGKKMGEDGPYLHLSWMFEPPPAKAGVITAPRALVMPWGSYLHLPWPRADMLQVACPRAPGRGLPHSGHPSRTGMSPHPWRNTKPMLGSGEGRGREEEKGAQSQKNVILGYISSPWQLLGNHTGSELLSTK